MKLAVFARFYPPAYSGAGRQASTVVAELVRAGVAVDVLTLQRSGREPVVERNGPATVHRLRGPWRPGRWSLIAASFYCCYWILRFGRQYDAVIFFSIGLETYLPVLVASLVRVRAIIRVSLAGSDDLQTLAESPAGTLRMRILSRASAVVCPSEHTYALSRRALAPLGLESRCVLVGNGVDTVRFSPVDRERRDALRREAQIDPDALVGVFMGWMHPRKAVDHLIREWAVVHRAAGRTQLVLAGPRKLWSAGDNAEYLDALDRLVREEGLEGVVRWVEVADASPLLKMSDVFVFASHEEGFPNALLEAMASGVPPVVVRRDWLPADLIEHGRNGILVSDAAGAMSAAMIDALNRGVLPEVGRQAREQVLAHFDVRTTAASYMRLARNASPPAARAEAAESPSR